MAERILRVIGGRLAGASANEVPFPSVLSSLDSTLNNIEELRVRQKRLADPSYGPKSRQDFQEQIETGRCNLGVRLGRYERFLATIGSAATNLNASKTPLS